MRIAVVLVVATVGSDLAAFEAEFAAGAYGRGLKD